MNRLDGTTSAHKASGAATLILVPGAWHGAWCWDRVIALLADRGICGVGVELPFEGFDGDVAATVAVMDAVPGPVVLCGHSYGGRVISAAAMTSSRVTHVVYIASTLVDEAELAGYRPWASGDRPGHEGYPPEVARSRFYNACSPEDAHLAASRLKPMKVFTRGTEGLDCRVWRDLPSTYVICRDDHAMAPERQRQLARHTTTAVELDCDHSPFLSAPAELAAVLAATAMA